MNTLEVTYADKAGRLIDQSPDKKAIEDLQTTVQQLQGKALKIYYVEDESIGIDDLADVEGLLDALNIGDYQAIHLASNNSIYYVVYVDSVIEDPPSIQLASMQSDTINTVSYYKDDDIWIIDLDTAETYSFRLVTPKPIYCHPVEFNGADFFCSALIFNNSSTPFTKETFVDYLDTLQASVGNYVKIITTGGINKSSVSCPVQFLTRRPSGTYLYGLRYVDARESAGYDTKNFIDKASFVNAITYFSDGVNLIN